MKSINYRETNKAIEYTIEQHLNILNSDIVLPVSKSKINEARLLATAKSREKVFNNLIWLLDNPEISQTIKDKAQKKALSGLKKTRKELIEKILYMPLRGNIVELPTKEAEDIEAEMTSDDILSNISEAIKIATSIIFNIEKRIEFIENPKKREKDIKSNRVNNSIIEKYAD